MDVSIIGHGIVGQSMRKVFPEARVIDPAQGRDGVVDGGIAFVCVPTPIGLDGACDTSIVREVVAAHDADIFVVRSTVPPGTCRSLGGSVVFQPEYLGMTPGHRYLSDLDVPFVILGGPATLTRQVRALYRTALPPDTSYHLTAYETAELVKYATNTFLATKVEFVNELHDACTALGIDYDDLRELWLLDDRIGRSHTQAGAAFGGVCFPKDIAGLVEWAAARGLDLPVIRAARDANTRR